MCSVEVVTLESLGARLCEALSTSNHNDNDCSKVEALIKSASKSFPKYMATSHVGPSGSQTDFESAFAALDAELKNRGTGGLDQDLLLPPELVQNSGSKEFFCYAIAVLIGSINKFVVIRAGDLDTAMSLLEDLTKEFFDLDDWTKERSMDLSAALTTLVGPSVVSVLASSPHLMAAMGIIVLVYFHRLQHHLEDRRHSKPTNCIVERADRMSQRSGHVSLDALVKTCAVHERQATPKGVFALCQNQRQDTRENCPFRSVSFIGGGINLCLFAEPSHLDGREGAGQKHVGRWRRPWQRGATVVGLIKTRTTTITPGKHAYVKGWL